MDKLIQDTLKLLGLTQKEIRFFESSFKLGPSSINEVAKDAHLKRATAYLIAEALMEKGLIIEDFKNYGKKIFTVDPQKLLGVIANKQRSLRRREIELEENMPELQAIYSTSEIKPKVKVFEGNNGLLQVWKDILSTKGELLIWTNQETDKLVFGPEKHISFIDERIKKEISARVLAVDNPEGKILVKLDSKCLRQTKLLPKNTIFSAETYIYDNKIAILDYKKDIIGIIIESELITNSQRALFELSWQSN